jgi:hypothetical protein
MTTIAAVTDDMRRARLDAHTPPLVPEATGAVTVNGSADLPARAGPLDGREPPSKPLSPARTALAAHLKTMHQLSGAVDHTLIPVRHAESKLKDAQTTLQQVEARQSQAETAAAAAIVEAVRKGEEAPPATTPDTNIQAAILQARSACNAYQFALVELRADQARTVAAFEQAKTRGEALLLDVLVEEHHKLVEAWARARDEHYTKETRLLGLHQAIGGHGRLLYEKYGDTRA